ncbi:MAG: hypothetical protein ACEQSA_05260 [Weeksellaceae bacterium]
MRKTKNNDLYEKINVFQQNLTSNKPSLSEMTNEVRMMHFKIRPLGGNITMLDFHNPQFIEALWSLGKLDEFFRDEYSMVKKTDQEVFFRLIDEMRNTFQQKLNKVNISVKDKFKDPGKPVFELEIVKDYKSEIN